MLDNFLNNPFWYSLTLTLLHFLWQGCAVALILKGVLSFIPHQKSQARYLSASFAMLANLLLPIITFALIYQPSSLPKMNPLEFLANEASVLGLSQNINSAWSHNLLEFSPYISLSWLAIVCLLVAKLLIELFSVHQLPKQAIVPTSEKLYSRFIELTEQLEMKKTPRLLISLKVKVPMAIGWLKPVVIIPASMLSGLTPAQLDMLMLHELAHIRRHDYLVNFLQTLVETLFFFHPAVHWIAKKMRNEREYCSDDIAVHHCGDPVAYAHTLADTASHCKKHRSLTIPSFAMAASGGDLKQRVLRLVDHHHCIAENHLGKWLTSILIILSVSIIALSQFVNFPMIDFSSGQFSFKPLTAKPQYLHNEQAAPLTQTSIAQSLLIQEQPVLNEETPLQLIANETSKQPLAETKITQVEPIEFPDKITVKETFEPVTPSATTNQAVLVNEPVFKSGTSKANIELEVTAQQSKVEKTLLVKQEKTAIESAFERTDSSSASSKLANPYNEQLANLTKPVAVEYDVIASSTEQTLTAQAYPKSSPMLVEDNTFIAAKTSSVVFTKAKLLKSADPKYPSSAKRRGIELDMLVNFTIDADGRVQNISFERKNKISYFKSSVKNAMQKWRFTPAKENGRAVSSKMSKIFSFSLMH